MLVRFGNGFVQNIDEIAVLAANVNVTGVGVGGQRGDQHALDQLVRIVLDQHSVFTRARLAFIRVHDDVFRLGRCTRNKTPLHAGGKTGAAAAAKI